MSARLSASREQAGLSDLVTRLQSKGFRIGTSETIDATKLLLDLAVTDAEIRDAANLRSRLRPVFCKSREEQRRFDQVYDEWSREIALSSRPAQAGATPPAPETAPEPQVPSNRKTKWIGMGLALLVAIGIAVLYEPEPPTDGTWIYPTRPTPAPGSNSVIEEQLPKVPKPPKPITHTYDAYYPAYRYNLELHPALPWLVLAIPMLSFIGFSLPALVIARTRARRRSAPMYLERAPLESEARRIVPPLDETGR